MSETVAAFAAAAEAVTGLVGRIRPAQWAGPGLGEWDLRALVGHTGRALSTVSDYLGRPAPAADVSSAADYFRRVATTFPDQSAVARRGREAGAALGGDPARTFADLAGRAVARARSADPDGVITCLVGGIRVRSYLPTRTLELVVHGLDIARAAALAFAVPTDAQEQTLQLLAALALARGSGDAAILALTGRAAPADGFTVL